MTLGGPCINFAAVIRANHEPALEITDPWQEFESVNALGASYRGDRRRVKKARLVAGASFIVDAGTRRVRVRHTNS